MVAVSDALAVRSMAGPFLQFVVPGGGPGLWVLRRGLARRRNRTGAQPHGVSAAKGRCAPGRACEAEQARTRHWPCSVAPKGPDGTSGPEPVFHPRDGAGCCSSSARR